MRGLESEVTAMRCIRALRGVVEGRLDHRLERVLLGEKQELMETDVEDRLALVRKAAEELGLELPKAQLLAVRAALEQRVTLIHGPPGTGKTTAAAAVVHAWRSLGGRILCAADSNVAADNLQRSLQRWGLPCYRFAPSEMHKASSYQQMLLAKDALGSFQVVVTTCASAGHELLKGHRFLQVLVDESTQSVEPSTLIPLMHGCGRLVLVGDHRQLPPTVISEEARRQGLETSLFARLARHIKPQMLTEQRRMHPRSSPGRFRGSSGLQRRR